MSYDISLSIGHMARTSNSVLAWRIPGAGEPGGLTSMGSHRVGHDWSDLAAAAANERDKRDGGSIPGLGRSPGRGHGNPLQCSFLENPMDWGAWQATVHRVSQQDPKGLAPLDPDPRAHTVAAVPRAQNTCGNLPVPSSSREGGSALFLYICGRKNPGKRQSSGE